MAIPKKKRLKSKKKMGLIKNDVGGVDLLIERDAGNSVRILTGYTSLSFWKKLRTLCDAAIGEVKRPEIKET